ncbi:MAG: hypothetical protein JWO37_2845 [Acidimicrobiales bacterium]|nr:hypothetical protein [Acidimicrobiales bacterium]
MIGRSFRIGLRLGLLAGVAVAVVKTLQSRRVAMEQAPSWDWSPPPAPAPRPAATRPAAPVAEPAKPEPDTPTPSALSVVSEPEPEPEPAPALRVVPPSAPATDESLDGMLDDLPARPSAPRPVPPPVAEPKKKTAAPKKAAAAKGPTKAAVEPKKAAAPKKAAKKAPATKKATAAGAPAAPAVEKSLDPPHPPRAWIEPVGNTCPDTHPVKAKLGSKLFHLPGMFAYPRTNPDRCYRDEGAATADGLTKAKR